MTSTTASEGLGLRSVSPLRPRQPQHGPSPILHQLEERHLGARRLSLTAYRVDGSLDVATVATAIASRDPAHLQRLLADKAASLDPKFGFDAFALAADWSEGLGAAQTSLVEEP